MEDYVTLTTPDKGHKVKVRNYATGGDKSAIRRIRLGAANMSYDEATDSTDMKLDASVEEDVFERMIERFIEDIDGNAENVVQQIYGMSIPDYDYVIEHLQKLQNDMGLNKEKKDESKSNTRSSPKAGGQKSSTSST